MLTQLYIRNFTLIDELDMDFGGGFSVITGETGAGKSIILGALGLVLGNRADAKVVKAGEGKCVVEAHFDIGGYGLEPLFEENGLDYDPSDCIVRREVQSSGKSRAYVNDTPVQLSVMKDLGLKLIDIHSQHQNQLLSKDDFQLGVIDAVAFSGERLEDYKAAYGKYRRLSAELESLREAVESNKANEEFLRFQYEELEQAGLKPGEMEELESESNVMGHSEEIKTSLSSAYNSLGADDAGAAELVGKAASEIASLSGFYPMADELAARLDSCRIELRDIVGEIASGIDSVDYDPLKLEAANNRIDTLNSLLQKYRAKDVSDLISLKENIGEQLAAVDNGEERIGELAAEVAAAEKECSALAEQLTAVRKTAAEDVERQMTGMLVPLGIPNVSFRAELSPKPLSIDGTDKATFLFSANKNSEPQPISQVASGGEVARVMLSIKAMVSGVSHLPTVIFDEIDTGVSGRVAESMAKIMRDMGAGGRQVIAITHLPQIAALGASHYRVAKEDGPGGTVSRMVKLDHGQRVQEIAQMLSGNDITAAAVLHATELLDQDLQDG